MIQKSMDNKTYKGIIKLNKVVSSLYIPENPKLAIIVAQGGPGLGDKLNSEFWTVCKKHGAILMVPDYIGFCRSDGKFNFKNCITTLYECEDFLKGKLKATDGFNGQKISSPNISKIVLVGSSWGGAIAPFIDKYKKTGISDLVQISPVTDWNTLGDGIHPEETRNQVDTAIETVMSNLYRGYKTSEWKEIFSNKKVRPEYNPIENLKLLKNKNVYVFHGNKDKSVHWSRSKIYVDKLKKSRLAKSVSWKLLLNSKHGGSTKSRGLASYFKTLK